MRSLTLILILASSCEWLSAQEVSTSQISGVIEDSSGSVIPNAQVQATQLETGLTRTAMSGPDGGYILTNLPVGPYKLQVTKEGFSTFLLPRLVLEVNSNPSINATLKIGAVTEQVAVEASAAMIETHSNAVGQVIDQQRIVDLPLNGREAISLVLLSGNAAPGPAYDLNTNKNYPTATISIAGGQVNGGTYLLDGGTHNDTFNNLNLPLPFPDALQEFKVETSATPARYGYHAAGAVNVVTKSGTNEIHGDAFEYVRNYLFNARDFFALSRDTLKRNQFGGTVGGPIVKNRLFFFVGYQGTIVRSDPSTSITYVPTQTMLNGDFTAFASAACNSQKAVTLGTPFVGNKVSPSLFSQQALNILKYVPISTDPCGRYQYSIPSPQDEHQGLGKVDYQLSQKHTLFGRYFIASNSQPDYYDGKSVLTTTKAGALNRVQSFVLGDTYLFGAGTVSSFHATLDRTVNLREVPSFFSPTDAGVNVFSLAPQYTNLSITGSFGLGGAVTNPGFFNSTIFQLAEDFDLIRGAHQISFGVNWIHSIQNELNNQFSNGQYGFTGQALGLGLADFMLGTLDTDQQGNQQRDNERNNYVGLYVQDSWKVTQRLVVNAGLRWDPFIPMHHAYGWVSHFDPAAFAAGTKSNVYSNAPAGILFPGDAGFPGHSTSFAKYNDFAPRLGIVWDPKGDGKMSIRASYGLFYDLPDLFLNVRFANEPPWGASVVWSNPAVNGFANPFATYPGGNPFPAILNAGKNQPFPLAGVFINYANLHTHPTYMQQWNLSFQKQIAGGWVLSASYLGNESTHLWTAYEGNPDVYIPGSCTINGTFFSTCSSTSTASQNARRVLNLRNSSQGQYYGTIATLDDGGVSHYDGLLVSAQRRLTGNFSLLANYTHSHCVSDALTNELAGPSYVQPGNRSADRGNCGFDIRHVANVSLVATSPRFSSRMASLLGGGWQLSAIVRAQSGNFATVTTGVDNALTGVGNQRPNQVLSDVYTADPAANNWQYLNKAAFASPTTGAYGNLGTLNIENPGMLQVDMGLSRAFQIREHQQVQIRWEVFNILNRLNPAAPTLALNSGLFGKITTDINGAGVLGQSGDPRIMQFAMKYTF